MFLNVGGTPNVAITEEVLTARATAAMRRNPDRAVLLKADETIPYGRAVDAMVILQHAGAKKVGFITQPLATRKPMGAPADSTADSAAAPAVGTAAAPAG
jgi:biopolymer transport protein TolR